MMLSVGKLLQLYISRDREYAADACGVALTGNLDLATALMKIDVNNTQMYLACEDA